VDFGYAKILDAIFFGSIPTIKYCHRKNGPGKNSPARPILDEKIVWTYHFWSTKNGPAGPFLVTKSGPGWLKMVRCQELSNNVTTYVHS